MAEAVLQRQKSVSRLSNFPLDYYLLLPTFWLVAFHFTRKFKQTTLLDSVTLLLITAAISMPYLVIFQLYQTPLSRIQYKSAEKEHRSSH